MKTIILFMVLLSLTAFAKEKETVIVEFKEINIDGTKSTVNGTRIDTLKENNSKTTIKPKEDFLNEISESVDEL